MSEVGVNSMLTPKSKTVIKINSYLETYANPDEIRAEGVVSPGETLGIRAVASEYELSKKYNCKIYEN